MVVSPRGVGLLGESDEASSYAVYELLDRLGCRWFMPGELGEVIPDLKTVTLKEVDFSSAPATIFRGITYADAGYKRRNRYGGPKLAANHALEMYITKEDRVQHPEWMAEIGGKPHPKRLKWSSPTLADAVAEKILARHARSPKPSYSLSPDDGANWDQSKDDKALDAGDFDPTFQETSITDRLVVLCNRVATKVAAKEPDVLLGMLAYVQYTRPPVREKLHPSIVPLIAPITYSRAHPMNDDRVPGNKELRYLIEGWGQKAKLTGMYFYGWFLSEPSAPNPMLARWGNDVPFVYQNNCRIWQPETIANFETSMHALYMGSRLAWDTSLKPQDVYDEINAKFYGHASKEMAAYWTYIDETWVKTPEYSGCGFGHMHRWTPERMAEARRLMNSAKAGCKSEMEKKRVQLADESLGLFELFMKLRTDQAEGRWITLAEDAALWQKRILDLSQKYQNNFCFSRSHVAKKKTFGGDYFAPFYQKTYDDAARIARYHDILTTTPIRRFRYQIDPEKKGETSGWMNSDFNDREWKSTDVCLETWSTLGHHDYRKSMWYRTEVAVPVVTKGRKIFLWLGGTDGKSKVFVNGKHVPFTDGKGQTADEAKGYCKPFSFDVTAALVPGAKNTIAILSTRTALNELGTGGLLAPVALYAEKGTQAPMK
jgi:hypothetical protein